MNKNQNILRTGWKSIRRLKIYTNKNRYEIHSQGSYQNIIIASFVPISFDEIKLNWRKIRREILWNSVIVPIWNGWNWQPDFKV